MVFGVSGRLLLGKSSLETLPAASRGFSRGEGVVVQAKEVVKECSQQSGVPGCGCRRFWHKRTRSGGLYMAVGLNLPGTFWEDYQLLNGFGHGWYGVLTYSHIRDCFFLSFFDLVND